MIPNQSVLAWCSRTPRLESYWAIEPKAFAPLIGRPVDLSITPRVAHSETRDGGYTIQNGVAVIDLSGAMSKYPTLFQMIFGVGQTIGDVEAQVRAAAADAAVNAILLRVDSPGGTVAGTSDLADAVFEARRKKTVYAYISDMGASAAYYVASQADRVYADADAMVGSIGVYLVVPDYSKMAEAEGVKVNVVRAGEGKGAGVPGTPVTESQLADCQREVDQLNEVFVENVARGRNWPVERVMKLNDGRVHVGRHAQALGLIDGIRTMDETLSELMGQSLGQQQGVYSWRHDAEPEASFKEDSHESKVATVS